MKYENLKIYLLNLLTFGFTFTNIENALKLMLLIFSIIYTAINIYKLLTKKDDTNK